MVGRPLLGKDGKPRYLMENGQPQPLYEATPEEFTAGFLTIEDLITLAANAFGGGGKPPQAGLTLPVAPKLLAEMPAPANPMAPPAEFMSGPSGESWAGGAVPSMGQLNAPATEGPWDRYLQTWQDPNFAMNYPFQRGDQNTGAGNVAAGFGNALVNLPQNLWHGYEGATEGVRKMGAEGLNSIWDFFTKTEGQAKAENAPPANPTAGFQPGIPGGGGGGANPLVNKITQVESGGKAKAKNPNSSAYGPGQFISSTWKQFIKEAHPELVTAGKLTEKELLELRSDPAMADEATAWYAGKAVDLLDSIDAPATDANIYLHHFLGPGGAKKLLTADPDAPVSSILDADQIAANKTILGGTRSVQDVKDWAEAKMGDASIGPYVPGAPPPQRPTTILPDFSAMNNWLDQAAPVAPNEEMLRQIMFDNTLAGFGAGIGSVNAEAEGGGALFGALAAGTTGGARDGRQQVRALQQDFQNQQRQYAGTRAGVAMGQENIRTGAANADAQSGYLDQVDMYNWAEGNRAATEERNLLISQEAKQKEAAAKLAATPQILNSSAQGIILQQPDGSVEMIPWTQNDQWSQIEDATKALGADSAQVRQMKYNQLVTSGANLMSIEMEIIKDIVRDGMGPAVFGESFGDALTVAEDQLPGGLAADPKLQMEEQQKAVLGLLLAKSQQEGNYDWILQAAALGHPGAMMLAQGGSVPE